MKQINAQKTPSALMSIAYVMLLSASMLYKYFLMASLPWWIVQICYISISMLCCAWILVTGELARVVTAVKATFLLLLPYVFLVLYSFAVWLFRLESVYYIRRGIIDTIYLMLAVVTVGCGSMVFGKKLSLLTFFGFAIGNALIVMSIVLKYGVGTAIGDVIAFLASGFEEETVVTKALEVHMVTFSLGGMLLWILVSRMKPLHVVLCALVCVFFLIVGWKRSLWPAVGVGVLIYLFTGSKRKETTIKRIRFLGIAMTCIALGYVVLIRSGIYDMLIKQYEIDVMGRDILYNSLKEYYKIDVGYMGQGVGFPAGKLIELLESGHQVLNGERSIHSDILAKYIELGMPCYLVWSYLVYGLTGTLLAQYFSERAGRIWMGGIAYCYVTYFSDNTAGYMPVIVMLCSITLSAVFEDRGNVTGVVKIR